MHRSPNQQTAEIVAFPTALRAAAVKSSRQAKFAADVMAVRAGKPVSTDSWYHQEAIEAAARETHN